MRKILLVVLAVCMGTLVYAEIPQQINFGGELYQFTEISSLKQSTDYIFTANDAQHITASLNTEKETSNTMIEQIAKTTIDSCTASDGCFVYKDSCAQQDILLQTVFRDKQNNSIFMIEFKRITPKGELKWQWDGVSSLIFDKTGLEKKLKAPLSAYRRAFCQLNIF